MQFSLALIPLLVFFSHACDVWSAPGEFDPAFGQNGIAVVPANGFGVARSVATEDNGRVMAIGTGSAREMIVRTIANGNPDTTFNGTGTLISPLTSGGVFGGVDGGEYGYGHNGVSLMPGVDGSLLAVRAEDWFCPAPAACGMSYLPRLVARRINSTGSVDASFPAASLGNGSVHETQILADGDGGTTAVSAGRSFGGGFTTVKKITAGGQVDAGFNAAMTGYIGCRSLPDAVGGRSSRGKALRLPDGKLLLAQGIVLDPLGQVPANFPYRVCVSRFNTDGMIDASYGNNGDLLLDSLLFTSAVNMPVALLPLPNGGAALVLQHTRVQTNAPRSVLFVIVWLTANGAPDPTRFGGQGLTGPTALNVAKLTAAAMQPDGKIVLAGYPESGVLTPEGNQQIDYSRPVVARLHQEGGNDLTFGVGGNGYTPLIAFGRRLHPNHLHIASDGSIFVAGGAAAGAYVVGESTQFAIAKLQGTAAPQPTTASQAAGGGGGCFTTRDPRVDPLLPSLVMLSMLMLAVRRRCR